MVGVKGKSGRKPDPYKDYYRLGKKTFYVKQHKKNGKWEDGHDFQWFKRHHGSRWQDVLRAFMRQDVKHFKDKHWPCKCRSLPEVSKPNIFWGYNHRRQLKCHKCGDYQSTYARRVYGDYDE